MNREELINMFYKTMGYYRSNKPQVTGKLNIFIDYIEEQIAAAEKRAKEELHKEMITGKCLPMACHYIEEERKRARREVAKEITLEICKEIHAETARTMTRIKLNEIIAANTDGEGEKQ